MILLTYGDPFAAKASDVSCKSLLKILNPDQNQGARNLVHSLLNLTERTDFPTIEASKIDRWHQLSEEDGFSGGGHRGVFSAIWKGRDVFIKISSRNTINEIRNSSILSHFKIGPRFHGTVLLPNGEIGLVFDFVEGIHLNPYSQLPASVSFSASVPVRIREIGRILAEVGFKHTKDLQFRVTREGQVYVVDTEFFSYDIPPQFLALPEPMNSIESPQRFANFLAQRIERYISQESN